MPLKSLINALAFVRATHEEWVFRLETPSCTFVGTWNSDKTCEERGKLTLVSEQFLEVNERGNPPRFSPVGKAKSRSCELEVVKVEHDNTTVICYSNMGEKLIITRDQIAVGKVREVLERSTAL